MEEYLQEKGKKFAFIDEEVVDIKKKGYDDESSTFVSKKKNKRRINRNKNLDQMIV